MNPVTRFAAGMLLVVLFIAASCLLLRGGVYGLTLFVVGPVCLGAVVAWLIQAETAWQEPKPAPAAP